MDGWGRVNEHAGATATRMSRFERRRPTLVARRARAPKTIDPARRLLRHRCMAERSTAAEEEAELEAEQGYVLPRYLRFARTLALVSGATVGISAGVAVISTSGCSCAGICGAPITTGVRPIPIDAADVAPDLGGDTDADAARTDAIVDAGAGDTVDGASDTGGGPRPAPLLPRAWMA